MTSKTIAHVLTVTFLIVAPFPALGCSVIGHWIENGYSDELIEGDLSGIRTFIGCGGAEVTDTFTASVAMGSSFHIDGQAPPACPGYFPYEEDLTFSDCNHASGLAHNDPSTGSGPVDWVRTGPISTITPLETVIKDSARVSTSGATSTHGGPIGTHSDLHILVTDAGVSVYGQSLSLQSDKPAGVDTITQPLPTDEFGATSAVVETQIKNPGVSHIISTTPDAQSPTEASITWLPARYEDLFETSCYVYALYSDYLTGPTNSSIPGLPGYTLTTSFLKAVMSYGSGLLTDGVTYIHYLGSGNYGTDICARTKIGVCAVEGISSAVDKTVVPLSGNINVATFGTRVAQDAGSKINVHHVDIYFGDRVTDCNNMGEPQNTVYFNNY